MMNEMIWDINKTVEHYVFETRVTRLHYFRNTAWARTMSDRYQAALPAGTRHVIPPDGSGAAEGDFR